MGTGFKVGVLWCMYSAYSGHTGKGKPSCLGDGLGLLGLFYCQTPVGDENPAIPDRNRQRTDDAGQANNPLQQRDLIENPSVGEWRAFGMGQATRRPFALAQRAASEDPRWMRAVG